MNMFHNYFLVPARRPRQKDLLISLFCFVSDSLIFSMIFMFKIVDKFYEYVQYIESVKTKNPRVNLGKNND